MVPTVERSEEHTSELQSRLHLVCRLLLRSEEHTSELQSRLHLVCRLLLEKKKHTSELQSRLHLVCRLLLEKKNDPAWMHVYEHTDFHVYSVYLMSYVRSLVFRVGIGSHI